MESDLISVIVPVYKTEPYLAKCIESILEQTYSNLEIILVDDGSPDNCGNICDEFAKKDSRIVVIHQKNGGLSNARNSALNIAKGNYIGFVDSDDYIASDMFETLFNLAKNHHSNLAMVSFDEVNENDHIINPKQYTNQIQTLDCVHSIKELLIDDKIQNYVWNKLYHRDLFETIRFPEGKSFEDISIMIEVFEKANGIVYFDSPKYHYLKRSTSIVNAHSHKTIEDHVEVLTKRYQYLEGKYPEIEFYNAYSFFSMMLFFYKNTLVFDFEDLFQKFEEQYPLLIHLYETYKNDILNLLDPYRMIILSCMLWDRKRSASILKQLEQEKLNKLNS